MGFRAIENDIKSGVLNRAAPILLYGEEHFLVDLYTKKLEALFSGGQSGDSASSETGAGGKANTGGKAGSSGEAGADGGKSGSTMSAASALDVSVFYGNDADDEAIIATLETFPMLSPLRIVIVKGHPGLAAQKTPTEKGSGGIGESSGGGGSGRVDGNSRSSAVAKRKNELAEYIEEIPDTSRLIFSSDKINKTRSLYKAIQKHGTVYEFGRLDEADLSTFIIKRVKSMGINIPNSVLDEFIFATGYLEKDSEKDLFSIENDIYKTVTFAISEGRDFISQEDVEECLPGVLRTDVFAMLDAISSGKKAEAIRLLESSLAGGENTFRLLSLITGHFEIMLGYKELSVRGHKPGEITKILGERSDWRVKKLGGYAVRFDEDKLKQVLMNLYETERNIKAGNISERNALTVLFAGI